MRTSTPLHAALTLKLIHNIADRAERVRNGDMSGINVSLTAGLVPEPTLVNCSRHNWTKSADACVSMVWHNYDGTNLSVPVWGCMARHMQGMGVTCTMIDERQVCVCMCVRVCLHVCICMYVCMYVWTN